MRGSKVAVGAITCALIGCGSDRSVDVPRAEQSKPPRTVTEAQPPRRRAAPPPASIADARNAVDAGRYRRALATARPLGAATEREIRERIANRVARQALAALRDGSPDGARALLRQADRYPSTDLTRAARIAYAGTQARARQRARDLQAQAQQSIRRRREAAGRDAAQRAMERSSGL